MSPDSSSTEMTNGPAEPQRSYRWVAVILHDVHFWVPVAVLVGGLLLLGWIH